MSKDLFRDSPQEMERRVDRLVAHFRHAEFLFYESKPRGVPNARDLLWLLLQEAVHTARNMPDAERAMVSRIGSTMPSARAASHDAVGIGALEREDYEVQVSRLRDGMRQHDHIKVKETPTETATDRMVDILDLLRFVKAGRRGKDAQRMKRCVLARAAGLTIEQCGRIWDRDRIDFDRRAMWDIRSRVLGQILKGIETEFGLVRTTRGFRRLTVREIEARAKAKKRLHETSEERNA